MSLRLALGRPFVALAALIAGECPCERCLRIRTNSALMQTLPRRRRRQLARDVLRRSGGSS